MAKYKGISIHFEVWVIFDLVLRENKTKYTMDPGIYFLMKANKKIL